MPRPDPSMLFGHLGWRLDLVERQEASAVQEAASGGEYRVGDARPEHGGESGFHWVASVLMESRIHWPTNWLHCGTIAFPRALSLDPCDSLDSP